MRRLVIAMSLWGALLAGGCDLTGDDDVEDPQPPQEEQDAEEGGAFDEAAWEADPDHEPETGEATYYADKFIGRPTASGEAYSADSLTCAHRTLPFGTRVRVTSLADNRAVVVRVNDRGPNTKQETRIVDLSRAAAEKIGLIQAGVLKVNVVVLRKKSH